MPPAANSLHTLQENGIHTLEASRGKEYTKSKTPDLRMLAFYIQGGKSHD